MISLSKYQLENQLQLHFLNFLNIFYLTYNLTSFLNNKYIYFLSLSPEIIPINICLSIKPSLYLFLCPSKNKTRYTAKKRSSQYTFIPSHAPRTSIHNGALGFWMAPLDGSTPSWQDAKRFLNEEALDWNISKSANLKICNSA